MGRDVPGDKHTEASRHWKYSVFNLYEEIGKLILLFFIHICYIFLYLWKNESLKKFRKRLSYKARAALESFNSNPQALCLTLSKFRNFCCILEDWSEDTNQVCKTQNAVTTLVWQPHGVCKSIQLSLYSLGHPLAPTQWYLTELSNVLRIIASGNPGLSMRASS